MWRLERSGGRGVAIAHARWSQPVVVDGLRLRAYEESSPNYDGSRATWSEATLYRDARDHLVVLARTVHEHDGGLEYLEPASARATADGGRSFRALAPDELAALSAFPRPIAALSTHPRELLGPARWITSAYEPPPSLRARHPIEVLLAVRPGVDVFTAHDAEHDDLVTLVALWALTHDARARARFALRAPALLALSHPRFPRVRAWSSHDAEPPLLLTDPVPAMREDRSLVRLALRARLAPDLARRITLDVLDALDHAHGAGLLHGALRPETIFLDEHHRVSITDLGLADLFDDPARTTTGADVSQLRYLAPERLAGAAPDARSDVYAAGVCLWEMLAGVLAFPEPHLARLLADVTLEGVPPLPARAHAPAALAATVARATARDPADRFPDAAAFRAALE